MADSSLVVENPWQSLRRLTSARIALGRAGSSLPTQEMLEFQLAHARARDAVHLAIDATLLEEQLQERGYEVIHVQSAANSRYVYLQRPDLGRRLDPVSAVRLQEYMQVRQSAARYDAVFVIADGLSALAVHQNSVPLLEHVLIALQRESWHIAPIIIAQQGRVALGDEIGHLLGSQLAVVLIGERPGLSSPDSLGIYLTYAPRSGLTDAERNCLSNVRPEGLDYATAAHRLFYLMTEARRLQISGVALKDNSPALTLLPDEE